MSVLLSLRVAQRVVCIVGGGTVALRKARPFFAAGAFVRIVAPQIADPLRDLAGRHTGELRERAYESGDLSGAAVVVVATDDPEVNAVAAADARSEGAILIDATTVARSDATLPATVRRGGLQFAIDTNAGAPSFAKRVAAEIEERFDERYGRATHAIAHARVYCAALATTDERRAILRELSLLPIDELAAMDPVRVEHDVEARLERLRGGNADAPVTRTAVCASRASALAMTQTRTVAARLAERGVASTILNVSTTGDKFTDKPIAALGENIFVTELEHALRDGRADYAVHSAKDLPSALADDMRLVAISAREDARDVYCSERFAAFASLPAGARVGTSSPRRHAQLRALRDDLEYVEVRGNVDTRLRKLREGQYDAIVLAAAGLNRLRLHATHTVPFALDEMVPAAAQGALAVEMRRGNDTLADALRTAINDARTELCVTAERAALRALRAGCRAPVGIHAQLAGETMQIDAIFAATAMHRVRQTATVTTTEQADAIGAAVGSSLARLEGQTA